MKTIVIISVFLSSCTTHYTYTSEGYMSMAKEMCSQGVKSYSPTTGRVACVDEVKKEVE